VSRLMLDWEVPHLTFRTLRKLGCDAQLGLGLGYTRWTLGRLNYEGI
jgi:hypothetical protein